MFQEEEEEEEGEVAEHTTVAKMPNDSHHLYSGRRTSRHLNE